MARADNSEAAGASTQSSETSGFNGFENPHDSGSFEVSPSAQTDGGTETWGKIFGDYGWF